MTAPLVTISRSTRAADALAERLAAVDARHLFGMPGSHTTTLYDAIALRPEIETILVRNEQAGAFMADGYARVTGKPGYICTTAGPGATNALTGVAEAWSDSTPVVLLAGQVNTDRLDVECGAYHEIDLEAIFRPTTKFCVTVRDAERTAELFDQAFTAATTGRPRPVALILPQDLMRREVRPATRSRPVPTERTPPPDPSALDRAAGLLSTAKRPMILAGGGALSADAAEELRTLADRLRAPIVTTLNGKGLIDERDLISLGHARSPRARAALPHADAMLAVGCRFTEVMTGWRTMPVPDQLVQIDVEAAQIGMNHPVAVGIVGDAREALRGLLARVLNRPRDGWDGLLESAREARPTRPEWLIETLREVVPDAAPVFTDACEIGYRMQTDWVAHGPRTFFYPSNYITLGWGFPAAIGAAVALRGTSPVFSVSGDGGFLMTAQELATAARYELPVIAIVHNDSTYGAIKNIQKREHSSRFCDVELNNPDFCTLAAAFGVPSARVDGPAALRSAVQDALSRVGPTVIEVPDSWRPIRSGC